MHFSIYIYIVSKNKSRIANESNRVKTFEEKSADYNRIKQRIFTNGPAVVNKENHHKDDHLKINAREQL